jgi:molybdate transport system regulatory protein
MADGPGCTLPAAAWAPRGTPWVIDPTAGNVFGYPAMPKRIPKRPEAASASDRLSIRLDLASGARIGPGKIAVLEEIGRSGSISAAGRVLRMSYRRTWELVEDLNRNLGTPVVETAAGGSGGGGAVLTQAGKAVIERYRAIEMDTALAARKHLLALNRACANK